MRPRYRFLSRRTLTVVALTTTLSCADMPTAPRATMTISGQISDRDGPGISQVRVYFISLDPRDNPPEPPVVFLDSPRAAALDVSTVTDSNGRYRVQLPAGPYRVVLEQEFGYPIVEITRFEAAPGRTELSYRYTGVRVTGTLEGPGGMALLDAVVSLFQYNPNRHSISAASQVYSSHFSLLVPPGTYELRAGAQAVFGLPTIDRDLTVAGDTTIALSLDGNLVSGVVRGPNGSLMDRVRIRGQSDPTVYPISTYSQADGSYAMYLPSGVYSLTVEPYDLEDRFIAGRRYPPVSITSPKTVDFDLSGVEWSGTVRRASDSTRVTDGYVEAQQFTGDYRGYAFIRTDASGAFRLVVDPNVYYNLYVNWQTGYQLMGTFATASDSTFDLYVDAPPSLTPSPPAAPGAPASAAADRAFRRRSSRTAE